MKTFFHFSLKCTTVVLFCLNLRCLRCKMTKLMYGIFLFIFQDELTPQHKAALSVLSYIGGSLSLIGCAAAIVMFRMFKYDLNFLKIDSFFFLIE